MTHNSRTCPMNNTIVPLAAVSCYFPVLVDEPSVVKTSKAVKKADPEVKKATRAFDSLRQCTWMFEEAKSIQVPKVQKVQKVPKVPKVPKVSNNQKTCSGCGLKGHNSRTCINACLPCSPPSSLCFAGLTATQACTLTKVMDCHPAY